MRYWLLYTTVFYLMLFWACASKSKYTSNELPKIALTAQDLTQVGYIGYTQKSTIIKDITSTYPLEEERRPEIKSQLKFFFKHLENSGFKSAYFNRYIRQDSLLSFTVNYYLFKDEPNAIEGKNDILKIYELITPGSAQDDKALFRTFVGKDLVVRSWMRSSTKEFLCLFVRDNLVIAVYCPYLDMAERILRLSIKHFKDNQQYDTKVPYLHNIDLKGEIPRTDFIPSPNDRNYDIKDNPDLRNLSENVAQEWLAFYNKNTLAIQYLLDNVCSFANSNETEKIKTLMFPGQSIPYFNTQKSITPYDSLYKFENFFKKRIGTPVQMKLKENQAKIIRFGKAYSGNYLYPVIGETEFKVEVQGKNTRIEMYAGVCVKMKQLKLLYLREE
jgi:hypothetical protein